MERRNFIRNSAVGFAGLGLASAGMDAAELSSKKGLAAQKIRPLGKREADNWLHLGKGKKVKPVRSKSLEFEVAVIGGGAAGICAAVSAARNGAKTVLVQDRPVLGGNASSEIRVHLNGVNHLKGGEAERETGVIEEMLLKNRFDNAQEAQAVWDHVLYDFVITEPNLELMLNIQALQAIMDGDKIKTARCWQCTTETEYFISADVFIDCSGDGLLAATSGAEYRTGREGKAEFNETFAPDEPDGWQMGATLLMSAEDMGRPMPYKAPKWALKYDPHQEGTAGGRRLHNYDIGIWWIEVGSDDDILADQEVNRHKLMCWVHGVWDYIKNSGKFPGSENMALDWVGSVPGRRESRRFVGDHILSERDLVDHVHFDDAVAYGGWSLDEHNPAGIEDLTEPPSYFHYHFSEVYQVPFRSLYSKNIDNLMFAGRNVSQTHIALSSTRIMATCSLMGQAVGTASALCVRENVSPRTVGKLHIEELQEMLMRDDVYIPKRPARAPKDLARSAKELIASSTESGDAKLLINGISRDIDGEINHWQSVDLPASVQMEWEDPVTISQVEIKCDTNVKRNIMMRKDSLVDDLYTNSVPEELTKALKLEGRVKGKWVELGDLDDNQRRLIKFNFDAVRLTSIRVTVRETYGKPTAKLFELRAYA